MEQNKVNDYLLNLQDKDKEPYSVNVLTKWIAVAEQELGDERAGRLSWLIASTVAAAKLQQVLNASGEVRFVMKGGTMLQHRLGIEARASRDLDGIVTEDIDDYIHSLDELLDEPWGNITFRRTPLEEIRMPSKLVNPRRFELILEIKGRVWRRILVEISPDEAGSGLSGEAFAAPRLTPFGLPTPEALIGISLSYQIAQKIHAVTDPHSPPEYVNNRSRDLVDILLLKKLIKEDGAPSEDEIRNAALDIFEARAIEARKLNRLARTTPVQVTAYDHWKADYYNAANGTSVSLSFEDAVEAVNAWIEELGL